MLDLLVSIQTGIHQTITGDISRFADNGDWMALLAVLPLGVLFGSIHALTPGHSKAILATYVLGDQMAAVRAALVAGVLAVTHIGSAVVIALGASFLVSRTITSAGQAPLLELISRGLLVAIGLWLIARAVLVRPHVHGEGFGMSVVAGLVPCPLTLFIMVFAVSQGVPEAGVTFAAAMLVGVGSVLVGVAILAVCARQLLADWMLRHGRSASLVSRGLEATAGGVLVAIALKSLLA